MKISIINRVLLLVTSLLAGYQVVVGIEGLEQGPMIAYTIAFGVLLVACLLFLILGYDALDSPFVSIFSTILPLSLSSGLVWQYLDVWKIPYLIFAVIGFMAIAITGAIRNHRRLSAIVLTTVHGSAGLIIFLLPSILAANGAVSPGFALVGFGGALFGIGGLLLSFLKAGKPIVERQIIYRILPGLLFLMTLAYVLGFACR